MTNPMPIGWKQVTLGDVGKVSMCKRILKHQTSIEGEIPFYKIGTFGKEPDAYISKKIYEEFKEKYSFPRKGEILISASGTIGRTVVYDGKPAYFQDSNIIWVANDETKVSNSFLVNLYKRVKWHTASGTIARLYNDNVRSREIAFPPLPEQHRIVAVLETWDKAIKALTQKIQLKKNIKKGLMQQLLTGKKRLSGFSGEWKTVELGDVFQIKKGSGLSKGKLESDGKHKCILYGEIYTTYSEVILEVKSKTNYEEGIPSMSGDILMPTSTTTSALDLATATTILENDILLGGDINILRPKKKTDVDSKFWAYFLTCTQKHELAGLAQGITIVHLYGKDLEKLKVKVPNTIKEQTSIAQILTTADNEITALEEKKQKLEDQKKYLLNNLITGQIRTPENLTMPKC